MTFSNNQIANQGQPFHSLELTEITPTKTDTLEATLTSHSSKSRVMNEIVVKGYKKFPKAFIKNFIGLKEGEVFSKKTLNKKVAHLKNLRFTNSIRPPEILFTKDSTSIYLYLEKRNSNLFDGFLGFATNEETDKIELNGNLNLQLINNLNYGERLRIHYKNDGGQQQRFQAEIELPYLFNSPLGITGGLELFRKDSSYTTNRQTIKLTYQLNTQLKLSSGYQTTSSNTTKNQTPSEFLAEHLQANYFTLGAKYQAINDYRALIPVKTDLNLELFTGNRTLKNSQSPQWKVCFNGSHIFQIDLRNSIYLHNQTGFLVSENYVNNELFLFGGINSLRGFEENSLFASLYSSLQTEYRYLLSPKLYVHSIIDAAYLENKATHNQQKNLVGVGLGLGLKTKAGLLQLDFANGKTNGQAFEFKNLQVHLSLTAVF